MSSDIILEDDKVRILSPSLIVEGDTITIGPLAVKGDATIQGRLTVGEPTVIIGPLTVGVGNTSIGGDTTIHGRLTVGSDTITIGPVTVEAGTEGIFIKANTTVAGKLVAGEINTGDITIKYFEERRLGSGVGPHEQGHTIPHGTMVTYSLVEKIKTLEKRIAELERR